MGKTTARRLQHQCPTRVSQRSVSSIDMDSPLSLGRLPSTGLTHVLKARNGRTLGVNGTRRTNP